MKNDFEYCNRIEDQEIYEQCCRECGRSPDGSPLPEEEPETPEDEDMCSMEALRRECERGVSNIICPDGTCWKCVNGEPVQVECGDTNP